MTLLVRSLWVAIAVDLAIAPLALLPIRGMAEALAIPLGEPLMHIRFAGLLFLILPLFYWIGTRSAALAPPIAGAAAIARALGVIFLTAHLLAGKAADGYWLFVAVEAAVGALHIVALRRIGLTPFDALRSRSAS